MPLIHLFHTWLLACEPAATACLSYHQYELLLYCCDETLSVCSLCFMLVAQEMSQLPASVALLCPVETVSKPLEQ